MTRLYQFERRDTPINAAIAELDLGPLAERYAIVDRDKLSLIYLGVPPTSGVTRVRVPFEYSNSNNLLVLMFDDSGTPSYFAVGNDKYQATAVDARSVLLNP